jgi:hypothetical protein
MEWVALAERKPQNKLERDSRIFAAKPVTAHSKLLGHWRDSKTRPVREPIKTIAPDGHHQH